MTRQWIDFKKLRERLDVATVLDFYRVELKRKGESQLSGFCPLPRHNGQRRSPSFNINLDRKCFQCFGCGAKGNVLDFCCLMEGKNPDDRQEIRAVALLLQERFGLECSVPTPEGDRRPGQSAREDFPSANRPEPTQSRRGASETAQGGATRRATIVNAPLDFELKGLDPNHPYLLERGFSPETIQHFGLGFCNRGLMQGRVVIPLRDMAAGRLIGYAGRFTRDDQVSEKVPKYLLPGDRERNGTVLEFRKSLFLYNGHAIKAPVRDLYVVEGYPSVWWLWQCGFEDVVALMGSSCSEEQATLILKMTSVSGRVWLLPDAGEAGERCALSLLTRLTPHRFCRWVKLDEGQPTDRTPDEWVKLLEWKAVP